MWNCFATGQIQFLPALKKSTNWGHYFYVSIWRRSRHFTSSPEPREVLAACSAKAVASFLSYFKTLSIGLAIEPVTFRSAVKRSTDWANPTAVNIEVNLRGYNT